MGIIIKYNIFFIFQNFNYLFAAVAWHIQCKWITFQPPRQFNFAYRWWSQTPNGWFQISHCNSVRFQKNKCKNKQRKKSIYFHFCVISNCELLLDVFSIFICVNPLFGWWCLPKIANQEIFQFSRFARKLKLNDTVEASRKHCPVNWIARKIWFVKF